MLRRGARICGRVVNSLKRWAETLFVTEKTIERHLSSAYHKLGIRSRFQLSAAIDQ